MSYIPGPNPDPAPHRRCGGWGDVVVAVVVLVLFYGTPAADGDHFGHSWYGLERIPQIPILVKYVIVSGGKVLELTAEQSRLVGTAE